MPGNDCGDRCARRRVANLRAYDWRRLPVAILPRDPALDRISGAMNDGRLNRGRSVERQPEAGCLFRRPRVKGGHAGPGIQRYRSVWSEMEERFKRMKSPPAKIIHDDPESRAQAQDAPTMDDRIR